MAQASRLAFFVFHLNTARSALKEAMSDYAEMTSSPHFVRGFLVFNEVPKYAFDVENSTGLGSGFQRPVQLQPLGTKLYIVAKDGDFQTYQQILNVDPYYKHKANFRFCSYKKLEKFFVEVDRAEAIKSLSKLNIFKAATSATLDFWA